MSLEKDTMELCNLCDGLYPVGDFIVVKIQTKIRLVCKECLKELKPFINNKKERTMKVNLKEELRQAYEGMFIDDFIDFAIEKISEKKDKYIEGLEGQLDGFGELAREDKRIIERLKKENKGGFYNTKKIIDGEWRARIKKAIDKWKKEYYPCGTCKVEHTYPDRYCVEIDELEKDLLASPK